MSRPAPHENLRRIKSNLLIGAFSVSPDGKTLLIGSNEKGGYGQYRAAGSRHAREEMDHRYAMGRRPGKFFARWRSVHLVAECGWAHLDPLHRREDIQGNTARLSRKG